jgi:hypothetical protein
LWFHVTKRLDTAGPAHRILPELPLPHKDHSRQLFHSHPDPHCDTARIHPPAGQRQTCRCAQPHGVLESEKFILIIILRRSAAVGCGVVTFNQVRSFKTKDALANFFYNLFAFMNKRVFNTDK